ncbi:MAG: rhodanese-like domain-containing protein [Myxococcales bacterium]|nr:rhodanese-like domain-containing protein [Myxococcales bacterium]
MIRSRLLGCFLLIALGLAAGCKDEPAPSGAASATATAAAGLPDRDPALAKKLVGEGALLLDVRTQEEWDQGHLEGATLIPIDELPKRLAEIDEAQGGDKDKPIVVYCRSGGRAGRAKQMLLDAGHHQVTNLGGMTDWPKD